MKRQDIIDAYVEMRRTNQTIPDEVLDYMYRVSLGHFDEEEEQRTRFLFTEEAPDYGDVIELRDWEEEIEYGGFTDDDGCGHWAREVDGKVLMQREYANIYRAPEGATHMVWFNK